MLYKVLRCFFLTYRAIWWLLSSPFGVKSYTSLYSNQKQNWVYLWFIHSLLISLWILFLLPIIISSVLIGCCDDNEFRLTTLSLKWTQKKNSTFPLFKARTGLFLPEWSGLRFLDLKIEDHLLAKWNGMCLHSLMLMKKI